MCRDRPRLEPAVRATVLLTLAACSGVTRLEEGRPLEVSAGSPARRLRLPEGPVELTFTPGSMRAQLVLLRGARRQLVRPRLDDVPHQLVFDGTDVTELEVLGPEPLDGGAPAVRPSTLLVRKVPMDVARRLAPLDARLVAALEQLTPPSAVGLLGGAQALEAAAAEARAANDAARAAFLFLAAADARVRTGDASARAGFERALDGPLPETKAAAHLGLARLDQQEGRLAEAGAHLAEARALVPGNERLLTWVRQLEADAMAERSEYARVLAHLTGAVDVATRLEDDELLAGVLAVEGWGWKNQGDRARALERFERQLEAAKRSGDGRLVGIALHNLGVIRSDFDGDWAAALTFLKPAIASFREAGDQRGLAFSLDGAGEMESTLGDATALERHREALGIRRALKHVRGEAQTLTSLGSALTRLHRPEEARAPLEQGAALFHQLGDTGWEAYAIFRLGRAELEAKRYPEAVAQARRALELSESLRERIASDDRRASFTSSLRNFFDLWVAAAAAQAAETEERRWFEETLHAIERFRARSLLDVVLRIDADRPADASLKRADDALRAELRELELTIRQERGQSAPAERLEQLEAAMSSKLAEFEALTAKLQAADPRAAGLATVPLVTLADAERLAGKDTLVVEYAFGLKSSCALLLGGGEAPRVYRLPAPKDVRDQATRLHALLSARNREEPGETATQRATRITTADAEAEALVASLRTAIVPFAEKLAGKRRLLVVADDSLHLVPWAALVPEVAVVEAPSLSVLQAERARPPVAPTHKLLVVGDPVFGDDDPRLRHEGVDGGVPAPVSGERGEAGSFRRLPFASAESEAVASLVPEKERQVWLGFEATRDRLLGGATGRPRILHFATHGVLDLGTPERSGLVLSRRGPDGRRVDGFLSLADVYALRLPVELVTLSACETALGAQLHGEGLIGLARGFLHAGARSVVATLWKVNDRATSLVMSAFYEGLLKRGLSAPEALVRAQRQVAADARYRSPYYWAAFVLVGDAPR